MGRLPLSGGDGRRPEGVGIIGPYRIATMNVTRHRGGYHPPGVLSSAPSSVSLRSPASPLWGEAFKTRPPTLPHPGGRWPFWAPNVTQRQRSCWGEDEQRKRGIRRRRRRCRGGCPQPPGGAHGAAPAGCVGRSGGPPRTAAPTGIVYIFGVGADVLSRPGVIGGLPPIPKMGGRVGY